jgi:hypothetical protein
MASLISFAAAASSPQVGDGNAVEVCAAALDGRLAAAFPALRELRITHQALKAMAQQDHSVSLAAALAGCGVLEALDAFALHSSSEPQQDGGALLAQLVARLPRLRSLSMLSNPPLLEVRAPCPEDATRAGSGCPLPQALGAAHSGLLLALLTRRRRCPPRPIHNARPSFPLFTPTAAARRGWRRSA